MQAMEVLSSATGPEETYDDGGDEQLAGRGHDSAYASCFFHGYDEQGKA
jgi:hypothetical protein